MVGGGLEDSEAFDVIPTFAPNSPRRINYSERARATKFAKTTRIEKVGSRAATSFFGQSETSYSVPLHITSHSTVG